MRADKHDGHKRAPFPKHDAKGDRTIGRRYSDRPRISEPARDLPLRSAASPALPPDAKHLVAVLMDIIEESAPMPGNRRQDLRRDVLELWRELTSERADRKADYIGEPAKLAAYLRYFLPWNVVRLVPILAGLELNLKPGDAVLDIGSGPLTVPIALWIARPELREMDLTIVSIDRVRRVLDAGTAVLDGLRLRAGKGAPWKLESRKGIFPFELEEGDKERYAFLSSANVFNESFWKGKGRLDARARTLSEQLGASLKPDGSLLIVEPGDPRTGAMIASLREAILRSGGAVLAPCPHGAACPMPGAFLSSAFRHDEGEESDETEAERGRPPLERVLSARGRVKAPWCHFALPSDAAPDRLIKFSESVGLPKDRLVASYLYARPKSPPKDAEQSGIRIVSDHFRLPDGGFGRYACCKTGYSLVRGSLADLPSGSLALLDAPLPGINGERDAKSGAVIIRAFSSMSPSQRQPDAAIMPVASSPQSRPMHGSPHKAPHHAQKPPQEGAKRPPRPYHKPSDGRSPKPPHGGRTGKPRPPRGETKFPRGDS
jgi:SAM-dependent methyltransferase